VDGELRTPHAREGGREELHVKRDELGRLTKAWAALEKQEREQRKAKKEKKEQRRPGERHRSTGRRSI
jgi:hypothetical protein